jgi:hypothetical protein
MLTTLKLDENIKIIVINIRIIDRHNCIHQKQLIAVILTSVAVKNASTNCHYDNALFAAINWTSTN